ncbi:response regulator transcription factor [Pedobacter sp.]
MKKSITILEDDEDIREICKYVFTDAGYTVSGFGSVGDFMAVPHPTDLFLLDIRLPDGSGIEVCKWLKQHHMYHHIPIILMSAHLDIAAMRELSQADGFMAKPFRLEQLLEQTAQLLP